MTTGNWQLDVRIARACWFGFADCWHVTHPQDDEDPMLAFKVRFPAAAILTSPQPRHRRRRRNAYQPQPAHEPSLNP